MTADGNNPDKRSPEQLARQNLCANGEVPPPEGETVDGWLRSHPESAEEFQSLCNFVETWRETPVPQPTPFAFDHALQNIERRLAEPRPQPAPRGGSTWLRGGLGLVVAGLAAALLLYVLSPVPGPRPTGAVVADEEPYPVATSDEITIISMDPRESRSLVVGKPPIPGDLEWASFDDVTIEAAKPNADNQVPEMHKGGTKPMIIPTPMGGGKEEDKGPRE